MICHNSGKQFSLEMLPLREIEKRIENMKGISEKYPHMQGILVYIERLRAARASKIGKKK